MPKLIQKILYGCSDLGLNAVEIFLRVHLLVFYAQVQKLPVFWVAIAIGISILWNAAIDPLIGRFSDDFRNRKGTRMHLVLVGAIFMAVTLAALFHPPEMQSQTQVWLYLLFFSLAFNTSQTLFAIPYAAMVGDYSEDRQQRSTFIAWKILFANFGALIGIAVPGFFLAHAHPKVYENTSWILILLLLFVAFMTSLAPPPLHPADMSSRRNPHPIREALGNRNFLVPLLASFFANVGLTLNTSIALYYYRIRAQLSEKEIQNTFLFFFLIFSLSLPLWVWISRKCGRKATLIAGALLLGLSTALFYLNLPVGETAWPLYLLASGTGGFFFGCSVLMDALVTDIVDEDHLRFGQERLGLYFGIWKFSAKASRAIALFVVGSLLDWANVTFPDVDTASRLSLIFGPGVGFFFIVAALILIPYSLTEKKCAEIKKALELKAHVKDI